MMWVPRRKRGFAIVGILLAMAVCCIAITARAETARTNLPIVDLTEEERAFIATAPVLAVSNEMDWPPFDFMEDGNPAGYSIDYMNLLAERLGLRIRYVNGHSWQVLLDKLKNREIDLIHSADVTPGREEFTLFTRPYMTVLRVLMTRDDNHSIRNLSDMAGKRLAMVQSYYLNGKIMATYPDIQPVWVESPLAALAAVSLGQADGYADAEPVVGYLTRKHFITNLKAASRGTLVAGGDLRLHIGVRKDWPILHGLMEKAMATVTREEEAALAAKWYGGGSGAESRRVALSAAEKAFLAARHGEIAYCVDPDAMPLERITADGTHEGLVADHLWLMADRLGLALKLVATDSWAATVAAARARKCDIVSGVMATPKALGFLSVTAGHVESPVVIAVRNEAFFLADLGSVGDRPLGVVRGSAFHELLHAARPTLRLVEVDTLLDGLRRVESGALFGFIGPMIAIGHQIRKNHLLGLKIGGKLDMTLRLGVGVRKDAPELLSMFEKAVATLSPEEKNTMAGRWIAIRFEESFDYTLLFKILGGGGLLLGIVVVWNRKLSHLNSRLKIRKDQVTALLDNSDQEFLSFGLDLIVNSEYSRACTNMLGRPDIAGRSVLSLLFPDPDSPEQDPDSFRLMLLSGMQERDGFRKEMFFSLLPHAFNIGALVIAVQYKPLAQERLMLVLTDVTDERALRLDLERYRKRQEMIVLSVTEGSEFFEVLTDFYDFLRRVLPDLLARAEAGNPIILPLYRHVHTFKGLFAQLSFHHLPAALHRVESDLSVWLDRAELPDAALLPGLVDPVILEAALDHDLETLRESLGEGFFDHHGQLLLSKDQVDLLAEQADQLIVLYPDRFDINALRHLVAQIHAIRHVDLKNMLRPFTSTVDRLAKRLEKEVVPLVIEGDSIRVDPEPYRPFVKTLVHVFRNAIDHGIETPDERLAADKDDVGRIEAQLWRQKETIRLLVRDDGRGIDPDAIRDKAVRLGLYTESEALELTDDAAIALIFTANLSTADALSDISGRGIGLSAVKEELDRLGGAVTINTELGQGTEFRFTLPVRT